MKQISDDAKWWLDICVGKITDKEGKVSDAKIVEYLSELSKIYDNKWYKKFRSSKVGLGPCPITMTEEYSHPFSQSLDLART